MRVRVDSCWFGIRRPVERVRSERALREPEPERDGALPGVPSARDAQDRPVADSVSSRKPAVSARHQSTPTVTGSATRTASRAPPWSRDSRPAGVAPFELHRGPPEVAAARHDVHPASDRARAPHGRAGAREDLDPLDGGHGDVEVEREMVALRVVDRLAVHEDERPVEVAAADPDVRLHAARAAPPHVDAEHGAQDVRHGVGAGQRVDLLAGHDAHDGRRGRARESGRDDAHFAGGRARAGPPPTRPGRPRDGRGRGRGPRRRCRRAGVGFTHSEDSESGRPGFCG